MPYDTLDGENTRMQETKGGSADKADNSKERMTIKRNESDFPLEPAQANHKDASASFLSISPLGQL